MKKLVAALILTAVLALCACGGGGAVTRVSSASPQASGGPGSGDPGYEARVVVVEGLPAGTAFVTVADLRALPQYEMEGSYQRTTGMHESFHMKGPYLSELIASLGGDLSGYAGVGVVGSDAYYCLLSREVIEATPDLMLAVTIDGEAKLDEDTAPARLAAQGQFGPYWVKMVERIVLYDVVPQKEITSVWAFDSLTEGIEPYFYEYYGSKDASIELAQIFSRLDYVDSGAFFTMKSSDGFKKNEVINMVKARYYIKTEGEDAPTNISPYIKLGMNVHHIAWFSSNADAVLFLEEMMKYMDTSDLGGQRGIPLNEALYEVEVEALRDRMFRIQGANGESVIVPGEDLSMGILAPGPGGSIKVLWQPGSGYDDVDRLLRIRLVSEVETTGTSTTGADAGSRYATPTGDTILTIEGDGVKQPLYLSLDDLKGMEDAYTEAIYTTLNNWPTRGFTSAKGADIQYLLALAGLKPEAKSLRAESADGYYAAFTLEQLTEPHYSYPIPENGFGVTESVPVKAIAAWAYRDGTADLSRVRDDDLRLFIGQNGINGVNTSAMVKQLARVVVGAADPGRWPAPAIYREGGLISMDHESMDQVKIHYTVDGSEPTAHSPVYNPSTSYFQPDMNQPFPQPKPGATIKAIAVGYGRYDSETAVLNP